MKNILKKYKGFIFLLTLNELNNKVMHISKLREKNMLSAILSCQAIDQIEIHQIIKEPETFEELNKIDNTPKVKSNSPLPPHYNSLLKNTSKPKKSTYEAPVSCHNSHLKTNNYQGDTLKNYTVLKSFTLKRYRELKDSTCNVFNKLQDEILIQYGYSCTLEELKNFCLVS